MIYTTKSGRVLEAIIYDGTNEAVINALLGFSATEVLPDSRLFITVDGNGSYYASIGDYIVYTALGFVEIMSPTNFE